MERGSLHASRRSPRVERDSWDFVDLMKVRRELSAPIGAKESVAVQLVTGGSTPADLDGRAGVCVV